MRAPRKLSAQTFEENVLHRWTSPASSSGALVAARWPRERQHRAAGSTVLRFAWRDQAGDDGRPIVASAFGRAPVLETPTHSQRNGTRTASRVDARAGALRG